MVSNPASEPLPRNVSAAVVVAHPDDEVLWCGGWILSHPEWRWRIVTLCRAGDPDRAPKFHKVLRQLGAEGGMGDLDDGPDQLPLDLEIVRQTVLQGLEGGRFDVILTHGPRGEYTRHRRHEECSRAVIELWEEGALRAQQLWLFAFEDRERATLPRAIEQADQLLHLPGDVWREKHRLIVSDYGFASGSWEARTTPPVEGFWIFRSPRDAVAFLQSNAPPP